METTSGLIWACLATAIAAVFSTLILYSLRKSKAAKKPNRRVSANRLAPPVGLSKALASALPDSVILPEHDAAFKQSIENYWAKQEAEVVPGCIVRPRNAEELSRAVTILETEYSHGEGQAEQLISAVGLLAIRGGGHSAVHCAASIGGGFMIDLSLFRDVKLSEDEASVSIGGGAKWGDVSKVLDVKNLAVAGGRNSDVGVGGLTLGGGLSFFSPRFGLVCSNILEYEVVLASGAVVIASATKNPDLWRALKGGANNFGIVMRFTARTFPSTQIWSGFVYLPSFQAKKVLSAFHEFVDRASPSKPNIAYDEHAAGPITCFTYIGDLGMQVISANLVYTKASDDSKWPGCWKNSAYASLWRFWSTCKVQSLTSATDELHNLNLPGKRQHLATTTIKNDPTTLAAIYAIHGDAIASIRRHKVKGISWTLVMQPMLPEWARKGDPNLLGLDEGTEDPLVIVSFTVVWPDAGDDIFMQATTRQAIERIEDFAATHQTGHRYRYLNYCAGWQKPFEGYGEENCRLLQDISKKYDPDGLFQRGCVGGFKLGIEYS